METGNAATLSAGSAIGAAMAGHDIPTRQNAQPALNRTIASRGGVSASPDGMWNRLENTVVRLQIQTENLQAAESRISDADVAMEMTNFVMGRILTRPGAATLSRATGLPRLALALL